jgi:hypothetical protein
MIYDLYVWYTKGNTYLHRSCFRFSSLLDALYFYRPHYSVHYATGYHSCSMYADEAIETAKLYGGIVKHTPGQYTFGGGEKL